jgi:hypothetical protein
VVVYDVLRNSDDSTPRDFEKKKINKNNKKWELGFSHLFLFYFGLSGKNQQNLKKRNIFLFVCVFLLSFFFRCLEASEEDDDDDDQQHRGSVMWYTWAVFGYFL